MKIGPPPTRPKDSCLVWIINFCVALAMLAGVMLLIATVIGALGGDYGTVVVEGD